MALSSELRNQLTSTNAAIAPLVTDIRARADYAKSGSLPATVATLQKYSQDIQSLLAKASPDSSDLGALATETSQTVQPALAALADANIALMNMGQLSTQRTIEPATAKAENILVNTLSDAAGKLLALLADADPAAPGPDASTARMVATSQTALDDFLTPADSPTGSSGGPANG
ncbi:MAG: hypothetical protein EP335_10705 [Alphaproteobacteria bacterium]|nr:MAG: hypothetical protein EP335_10705 [Alphaproteobacteria bacterium]